MLIRSQDKECIVILDSIGQLYISNTHDKYARIYADFQDGRTAELGKYEDKGKAIKVLDKIQDKYENVVYENAHGDGNCGEYATFQMPLDGDV